MDKRDVAERIARQIAYDGWDSLSLSEESIAQDLSFRPAIVQRLAQLRPELAHPMWTEPWHKEVSVPARDLSALSERAPERPKELFKRLEVPYERPTIAVPERWRERSRTESRSPFEWVQHHYREWIPGLPLKDIRKADPELYQALLIKIRREGRPQWLAISSQRDETMANRASTSTTQSRGRRINEAKLASNRRTLPKVFLSYGREDEQPTKTLRDHLRKHGFDVWFDRDSILPGQRWKPAIVGAIRSADAVVVLLSKRSSNRRGFLNKEIREALDVVDEQPDSKPFLIPARLDDCEFPQLGDFQRVDMFPNWSEGLKQIRKALLFGT
jgi:hypothetical protein